MTRSSFLFRGRPIILIPWPSNRFFMHVDLVVLCSSHCSSVFYFVFLLIFKVTRMNKVAVTEMIMSNFI